MSLVANSQLPKSIAAAHAAFESGRDSPSKLARAYLDREAAARPSLNAWITRDLPGAQAAAQAAEAFAAQHPEGWKGAVAEKPLLGIPVGIKDNIAVKGMRMTCASLILYDYVAQYDATVVARLKAAGAVVLGKTNLDEFAMGSSTENSAFGPVLNPLDVTRVPGGSSGGSAAAVAGGECLVALGSDTGGSIRLPAAFCGVTGFKPTYGRVSRYGLTAFGSSLDQIGPLAGSVDDCEKILSVLEGPDGRDATCVPWQSTARSMAGKRIGIPTEYLDGGGLSAGMKAALDQAIERARQAGAEIVTNISLPNARHAVAVYYVVAVSEASSNLSRFDGVRYARPKSGVTGAAIDTKDYYRKARSRFGPEVKRRIILGTFALSSGYHDAYYRKAGLVRRMIQMDFEKCFQAVDLILGPTAPGTAFEVGAHAAD
ncbi:MAG: amidase family protein, partial [Bdellovibrionota bacterium]